MPCCASRCSTVGPSCSLPAGLWQTNCQVAKVSNVRHDYQQKHGIWLQRLQAARLQADRLSHSRLAVAVLIVLATFLAVDHRVSPVFVGAGIVTFAVLLVWHERVKDQLQALGGVVEFYQEGLHRLDGTWMKRGQSGTPFLQPDHPYHKDLDLFGQGSLFEYLCQARTRPGQVQLAAWLSQGALPAEIEGRQQALRELAPRQDLRETLSSICRGRSQLTSPQLGEWVDKEEPCFSTVQLVSALLLGFAGVLATLYWLVSGQALALGLILALQQPFRSQAGAALVGLDGLRQDLPNLIRILSRLEGEKFSSPLLQELWQPLQDRPSRILKQLQQALEWLESRRNPLIAPLMAVTLAPVFLVWSLHRWKTRHRAALPRWMDSLGRFEALLSLATYAWEHPDYSWPSVTSQETGLSARELGHPLLGPHCVGNDLDLKPAELMVVSGSNMAGKSSLLRALGSNVVLAMAGAPVRARELRMEPLLPAASLQVQDSLMGGLSRFYAELLRLRQIVGLAGGSPRLLFLLDEVMAGTNSHDRCVGVAAIASSLLQRGALGLLTTHDLALTQLQGARNFHFEDHLQEGKMAFDYRLKEGPVTRSNALELMRAVGLEVSDPSS